MKRAIALYVVLAAALAACNDDVRPTTAVNPPAKVITPPSTPPTPAPPPPADDTPAVQAALNAGGTVQLECRAYYFSKSLMLDKTGTTLKGCGASTVLHWTVPTQADEKSCYNGAAIQVLCGPSNYAPRAVTTPIAIGDTSMTVADPSGVQPGDWLIIGDWGVLGTYAAVLDWVQVASVNGDTITFTAPSRVAINDTAPFVAFQSGMGYVRMIDLEAVTIEDLTMQVDAQPNPGANFLGVYAVGTIGTTIQRVTINNPFGNPVACEFCKSMVVTGNVLNGGKVNTEIASALDTRVTDNVFTLSGLSIDLGAAFYTVSGNHFEQGVNIGIYCTANAHDGTIASNIIDYLTVKVDANAVGIYLQGSPNVRITGNSLAGGVGSGSIGIYVVPQVAAPFSFPDTGDVVISNTVQGFASAEVGP